LKQIIRQKDQFLATVSHELRTPMNGVFAMADALSRTRLDQKQQRYLSVLRDACDSMLSIANQLLEKGKLDSGQTVLVPVDFDVAEFAASKVAEFSTRAAERGLVLELDTKILIESRIRFDKMRLAQVLGNLISNAIRYTDEGRVVVRVILQMGREGQRRLILSVEDSGIGIAPEKHRQIFEPFSSADPAQSASRGGTGLGLNVVRDLVALMGGHIRVESSPGMGSTFTVELVVEAARAGATPVGAPPPALPSDLNILLAEDNDSNAFVFEVLLEESGAGITRVRNGEEAVLAHERTGFDVIFMDIQMPVMSGIEAAAAIREAEAAAESPTPIIALSADAAAMQSPQYQAARFTGALIKPVRQRDLLDMLALIHEESG
jgi:CheY-like chemotaxis protein